MQLAKVKRSETINQLHAAARVVRTALAANLSDHGFHAGQDGVMLALSHQDGQTPGQLAGRLGVRPPTITKTINRLSAQGRLEKRPSAEDQRQANVFLTESGHQAIRDIERAVKRTEKIALKGFDKKDRKTLFKLLARVESNLLDGEPEPEEADVPATLLIEAAAPEEPEEADERTEERD